MAAAMDIQDQVVSPSLIRLWSRRMTLAGEELDLGLLDDLYNQAEDIDESVAKSGRCSPCFSLHAYHQGYESDVSDVDHREDPVPGGSGQLRGEVYMCLDGSMLRDVPARYTIPTPLEHEFPAVGVWLDPRITPGFRYRVRPIQDKDQCNGLMKASHFFGGRALVLESIGRGYSRRVTFHPDPEQMNENRNYFWTDSWPLGFAFELVVTAAAEKFTLLDANHIAAGTLEILENMEPQQEIGHTVLPDGSVEKTVRLRILGKVEWFDGRNTVAPVSGVASVVRSGNRSPCVATVSRITKVSIGSQKRGFILVPGVNDRCRCIAVNGRAIADIPTQYTITGLDAYEMPVIGTYVDPRILPGFHYRVRPACGKRYLFDGRALRLSSIGIGYGKRLTFTPDENSLNSPTNYMWSDSYPDGMGFEPRAVMVGMKFAILTGEQDIGEATVFRTDLPQVEVGHEVVKDEGHATVVKHIRVDVTCHVLLRTEMKEHVEDMRVSGTAVVERAAGRDEAVLRYVDNIGLDSQLNLLFVTTHAELLFIPL